LVFILKVKIAALLRACPANGLHFFTALCITRVRLITSASFLD
jgi:hypothetical protein